MKPGVLFESEFGVISGKSRGEGMGKRGKVMKVAEGGWGMGRGHLQTGCRFNSNKFL